MAVARIKLSSVDTEQLNQMINQIKDIAKKTGVSLAGPIPLPTKRLKVSTRTAPDGRGRELYEMWEMRVHKRVLDIAVDDRALRLIMRLPMPKDVNVEIEMVS